MNSIWPFIKTTRPINLLIIIATMLSMRILVEGGLINHFSTGNPNNVQVFNGFSQLNNFSFFLATLIMVILAASGNLINDYFDVKVDRINKPERITVGKTLKRRVAMISHHALNILAAILGFYLGWREHSLFYATVPLLIASLLWFYSFYLKKTFLLGNILVALVISIVPIWSVYPTFIGGLNMNSLTTSNIPAALPLAWNFTLLIILFYTVQAYVISLFREIIKDAEDIKGDSAFGYKTLPILWGFNKTKQALILLMSIWLIFLLCVTYWIMTENIANRSWVFFLLVVIPFSLSMIRLMKKDIKKKDFSKASYWLKVTMIGGLVYTVTLHHLIGFIIYHIN